MEGLFVGVRRWGPRLWGLAPTATAGTTGARRFFESAEAGQSVEAALDTLTSDCATEKEKSFSQRPRFCSCISHRLGFLNLLSEPVWRTVCGHPKSTSSLRSGRCDFADLAEKRRLYSPCSPG